MYVYVEFCSFVCYFVDVRWRLVSFICCGKYRNSPKNRIYIDFRNVFREFRCMDSCLIYCGEYIVHIYVPEKKLFLC